MYKFDKKETIFTNKAKMFENQLRNTVNYGPSIDKHLIFIIIFQRIKCVKHFHSKDVDRLATSRVH